MVWAELSFAGKICGMRSFHPLLATKHLNMKGHQYALLLTCFE